MNLLDQMETLFGSGTAVGLTDGQILERIVVGRNGTAECESAFAAVVDRHGAMVLRVCRQVLGDEHEAEDAAQATFLVLARRAGSIGRRDSLGSWLYGVALRVARKARVAAARRRAREQRQAKIAAASRVMHPADDEPAKSERWAKLHSELARLPESFRQPLVLCYFEGLTHEEVAARLRCPLGTIQSRLARGKAKLKARLEKTGVHDMAVFLGSAGQFQPAFSAPRPWFDETVRLAAEFARGKGSIPRGASASALLAEGALKAMVVEKIRIVAVTIFLAGVVISAGAAWARRDGAKNKPHPVAARVEAPQAANPPAKDEFGEEGRITRTVRGIVRDQQGRPVTKAWVGKLEQSSDHWELIQPQDRIRERREPFRDDQGKVVPPGALGRYFEMRDEAGNWKPLHPLDIARYDPTRGLSPPGLLLDDPTEAAFAAGRDVYEVRTSQQKWQMAKVNGIGTPALRTDEEGYFETDVTMYSFYRQSEIQIATPDFKQQALIVVNPDDPDRLREIVLKPARLVKARLIEDPVDRPADSLSWTAFALDVPGARLVHVDAINAKGVICAGGGCDNPNAGSSPDEVRRLEVPLCAGRYRLRVVSNTVERLVDIVVPDGDTPLALPDIHLKTLANLTMVGKPAAEIQAVDLGGKPVRLADHRGKLILLYFLSVKYRFQQELEGLIALQKRFAGKPLVTLILQDAQVTSADECKKALASFRDALGADPAIRFLLDRPPVGKGTGPYGLMAGDSGSGMTADIYEAVGTTRSLVIDKGGVLAAVITDGGIYETAGHASGKRGTPDVHFRPGYFSRWDEVQLDNRIEALEGIVAQHCGAPKLDAAERTEGLGRLARNRRRQSVVVGKVVDIDGRPVAGADLAWGYESIREKRVRTGSEGDFRLAPEEDDLLVPLTVRAAGFAAKRFVLDRMTRDDVNETSEYVPVDSAGRLRRPLVIGPGVDIAGRLVRNGTPIIGATIGLMYNESEDSHPQGDIETKTDEHGSFRFLHLLPETVFWVYAKLGTLKDQGALIPMPVQTAGHGTAIDLGDLRVEQGRRLAGRVICSDGKPPIADTRISVACGGTAGTLESRLDDKQRFEFKGLPDGPVYLRLFTLGYRFAASNKCRNPQDPYEMAGRLDRDVTDLTILLEPGQPAQHARFGEIDPTTLADFEDAKAGPIFGVPPRP